MFRNNKMKTQTNNLILILAIIAVAVSVIGMGITYSYLAILRNKITGLASSGTVNITIEESVSINFTTDTIDWGSGRVTDGLNNATLNTADSGTPVVGGNWTSNTAGFVVENIGNTNVTFSLSSGLNAAGLVGGTAGGGPEYQYNVSNVDPGSCIFTGTEGAFLDANSTVQSFCTIFDNSDGKDTIRIDLRLVIPSDSTTGALNDTIVATVAKV